MAKDIIAEDANGNQLKLVGDQWVPVAKAPRKLTKEEDKALNTFRDEIRGADDIIKTYDSAAEALKEFKPGQFRGTVAGAVINDDNGAMDAIGSLIGGVTGLRPGYFGSKGTDAYTRIMRARAEGVSARQITQKGVQTDKDAARYALAELSPTKSYEENMAIVRDAKAKLERHKRHFNELTKWTNKYGMNALNESGQTFDEFRAGQEGVKPKGKSSITITRKN